ncbi:MAG: VOC family protein [Armatimonadota bacterium]
MPEQRSFVQGFHHIAIRARDFDASVAFYTQGVGLTPMISWGEGDGRAIMLAAENGNAVEIFAGGTDTPKPEGAWLHLAFTCDDCDAALAGAVAAGATVTMEPTDLTIPSQPAPTPVRIAFCTGPDGEVVEFFQRK